VKGVQGRKKGDPTMSRILNFINLRVVLRWAATLAALLLVVLLYVALVGISFEAGALRSKTAALLTENLGREVRLTGPLHIEVSAHPNLVIHGLQVANAAGFAGDEFAGLGEARLALDLWPLLRLRLQIEELSGRDMHVRLQLHKNGDNNWTFHPPVPTPAVAQPQAAQPADSAELAKLLARLDIKRVSLQELNVEFIGADAKSHFFELQSFVARSPAGQPLALTLRGTVEKTYPYKLDFTGGAIAELVRLDQPWPIDLALEFMSSHLTLKGNTSGRAGAIGFDLGTADLSDFERLLQTKLPAVGDVDISGLVEYSPGKVSLTAIRGHMGKTTIDGSLAFDDVDARPKLRGELTLPVLDLRPFISDQPASKKEPAKNLAEVYREFTQATFSLSELNSADADLSLHIGQWLSLPGSVHDASLQIKLDHGRLTVPVQATVEDVPLSGAASADASVTPPRFHLALGTHDSSLGNLAELLAGIPDIRGTLGRFDLLVEAQGDRGSELMESLDVRLKVERGKMTYGNAAGGRPVQFSLDQLAVSLPAGQATLGDARGSLLGTSFKANLHGGTLKQFMQGAGVPTDFELQAGSARARVQAVSQPFAQVPQSDISFDLSAPHSGEIAGWLGLKPGGDAPIQLHGKFHTGGDGWHLADARLQLGRSDLAADVLQTSENGKPLIKVRLTGDLIDVEQLQSLLPEKDPAAPAPAKAAAPAAANLIDIPILPTGVNLAEADILVRIKRVVSASPLEVRDLHFDGHMREGMMAASPFAVNVADNNFDGTILVDLRTQEPHSALSLSADRLDIGSILNKLGIARNIEARIEHARLQLDLRSSRLGQLLAQSEIAVDFEGGHLALQDPNTGAQMQIALDRGELKSSAGSAVRLDLRGSLDKIPVAIDMQTAKAVDLINPALPIPFEVNASASGAALKLSGDIDRPFSDKDVELALDLRGSRLDSLNALAHASLPPWGPWSVAGKFHMSRAGYEVSSLLLQVGQSQLTGHGKLDTTLTPPRIDIVLAAPTIQLDDFRFGDWSPEKSAPKAKVPEESIDQLRAKAAAEGDEVQQILSAEVLRRQNAYLTVSVDQVVSGQDPMGSGKLEAKLENGHAVIGPVAINTPGGSATLRLGFKPGDKDVGVSLRAAANHFDYGILARRVDPKTEMRGILSFDIDVSARAEHISELWRYGKGHVDFAVWPENLKSGLLDMWAVNVLMALLPAVDSSNASKVNCAIGRFVMTDGKMTEKTILIDTSRMRVRGKGGVDFGAEEVQLYVQPRAKTPQFFSFALPIELGGNLNDFHVGLRPGDVLETVLQLVSSVITVPIQSLFGKTTPADGRDVCAVDFK
jgi:uncharacterized protein involved in outer membrane biogenesis